MKKTSLDVTRILLFDFQKKKKKKADILIIVKDKDFLKKGTMHNFISFKHKWI